MMNPKRLVYGENWVIGIIIAVPVSWLKFLERVGAGAHPERLRFKEASKESLPKQLNC